MKKQDIPVNYCCYLPILSIFAVNNTTMTDAEYKFIYKLAFEEADMYLCDVDPNETINEKDIENIVKKNIQFFIDRNVDIDFGILYSDIKGDIDAILDAH